jgi:5-methylcytosine-specific restriction protein A
MISRRSLLSLLSLSVIASAAKAAPTKPPFANGGWIKGSAMTGVLGDELHIMRFNPTRPSTDEIRRWGLELEEQLVAMPGRPKVFRPAHAPSSAAVERHADARRGSAAARGYGALWAKASAGHRRRHPLCVGCLARGRTEAATCTDHVIPAADRPDLFWDSGNWQSGCDWCHNTLKQRLEIEWRLGRVPDAALRLDSPQAIALAFELRPGG